MVVMEVVAVEALEWMDELGRDWDESVCKSA